MTWAPSSSTSYSMWTRGGRTRSFFLNTLSLATGLPPMLVAPSRCPGGGRVGGSSRLVRVRRLDPERVPDAIERVGVLDHLL